MTAPAKVAANNLTDIEIKGANCKINSKGLEYLCFTKPQNPIVPIPIT